MTYYRRQATVAQINAAAEAIAAQVADLPLAVAPNGTGHRIACTVPACGWSKCHDTITSARDHAATHAA